MLLRLNLLAPLSALALLALQCKSSTPYPANTPVVNTPEQALVAPDRKKLNDEQIAAITTATNKAELAQGKLARDKAKDPSVRDFAAMMIAHHEEAAKEQQALDIPEAESLDSEQLDQDATAAFQTLQHKSGADFDRAYMQLQIDQHAKTLAALKRQLPAVKDVKLKAYLEKLTPALESQLAQAEQLSKERGLMTEQDRARTSARDPSFSSRAE